MRETFADVTRRQTLAGLGSVSALALLPACARSQAAPASAASLSGLGPDAALDRIAYRMLAHEPGRATGLGVDTGEYAAWRSTFGTPGQGGREDYAAELKTLVAEARAYPKDGLTSDQQIGFEVGEHKAAVPRRAFAGIGDSLSIGHHDQHRFHLPGGEQVVGDGVGAALGGPVGFAA